jgi:16S rRNA (cytosine967-C5)-methyltransferase
MTPAARVAAAIEILDRVLAGEAAEKVLTQWGRDNRYAGSGDRAAVRTHVFGALRKQRSLAAMGGAETGRGIMIGALREAGEDPAAVFTGVGHAPAPLNDLEREWRVAGSLPLAVRGDMPDWLSARMVASLGEGAEAVMMALRDRAGVHLRVNTARVTRAAVVVELAREGIVTVPHPEVETALVVTGNERKVKESAAYRTGLVELQDASSQAAVLRLPLRPGDRVLDYCAGGGGKTLAMGARMPLDLIAHDAAPGRMADLGPRAARAGVAVRQAGTLALAGLGPFDLVLVDAPCSGSGTWRRAPEAKWRLTPGALDRLMRTQDEVLTAAARLVRMGGHLAYATCSVLLEENDDRVRAFLGQDDRWNVVDVMRLWPGAWQDGFYLCVMVRVK